MHCYTHTAGAKRTTHCCVVPHLLLHALLHKSCRGFANGTVLRRLVICDRITQEAEAPTTTRAVPHVGRESLLAQRARRLDKTLLSRLTTRLEPTM